LSHFYATKNAAAHIANILYYYFSLTLLYIHNLFTFPLSLAIMRNCAY